jgi:hypothetical protein
MTTEWLDMWVGTEPNPGPMELTLPLKPGDLVRAIGSSEPIGVLVGLGATGICTVQVDRNYRKGFYEHQIERWVDPSAS